MASLSVSIINNIQQQYLFYSTTILLPLGCIGNLCEIFVFMTLRSFRGNQCTFIFIVESISNIGLLLSIFVPYFDTRIQGQDPTLVSVAWCKLQGPIQQIFGLCSLFTICFLTFDQYMCTNPRPHWRQIISLKFTHRFIFFMICFVILHSIPFFIFTELRPTLGCNIFSAAMNSYYRYFYYPILNSSLPLTITVVFSLFSYRNVRRIVRRQIPIDRRRLDQQLTAMVLARVVCLISLGLPYILYNVYRVTFRTTETNQIVLAVTNFINSIVNSMLYINFSVNFYLFLIISTRFRRQVKRFIIKKYLHFIQKEHSNRNQVAPIIPHVIISNVESL
ncbi:unnamed protein product [Adineta steineri]|uniref:G-protein coupled receptors family 1 profile domain-containing protein n=2 Tax=Adineta steineri TaxID=433720 RepID=A0A818MW33_9BILA|nr:unnamed protein product [Adineta steineri]